MTTSKADAALDFRFAWRWLLPLQGCGRAVLQGFGDAERLFWQTALLDCGLVRDGQGADALIVDADHFSPDVQSVTHSLEQAQVACVVGRSVAIARWRGALAGAFPEIREYGLLPASNPRIAVPLDSPRHARIALRLHQPGRRLARWGVGVARLLAGWGVFFPLRRRVLMIAVRDSGAEPAGAVQANVPAQLSETNLSYALYLGAAVDNRKTVVLPIGAAEPTIILKDGVSLRARQSLKNEAAALEALRESPIASNVPKLLGVKEHEAGLTLFQEYRPKHPVARPVLDAVVIDFLVRLSTIDRQLRPLCSVLANMASPESLDSTMIGGSDVLRAMRARLQTEADKGMMIWEHRSHGDFAPWNCSWTTPGLFVYDWEGSRARDIAFGDAFYYMLAPALYIGHNQKGNSAVRDALGFVGRVSAMAGLDDINIKLYLSLWCLQKIRWDVTNTNVSRQIIAIARDA